MASVRVYELSKDLNKSNKEILNVAKGLGISVRSHASSISDSDAKQIIDKIKAPEQNEAAAKESSVDEKEKVRVFKSDSGAETVEKRKGARVVLRRKKKQEEPMEPEASDDALAEAQNGPLETEAQEDLTAEARE